ncbi:alpha/beta hydrolase [Streptomyces johnsoniae]|uniref:Alpha/beta hydrolase n=1 Tax=Streptomyces johnsoniae TaxID=3075532 RepID=A0ABU2S5I8_9ACTN|nr:alpha/beta hydrolase [Streptomyces sp. DSM 41886]MDT0444231.1 alpha/beta hydrolase [Streptomyces sp. DSM 41886]
MSTRARLHRTAAFGATLLLVGMLGACTSSSAEESPEESPDESSQESSEELRRFYEQDLAFEPCEPYATTEADAQIFANEQFECARMEAPMDYDDPGGETVSIALLRLPAKGEPIGSLLTNPGGPGYSGLSFPAIISALAPENPVVERFDLIGVDPRGVGASTPALDCYTDAERENDALSAKFNVTEEQTRQWMRQCAERTGSEEFLSHVGTRDAARDMDVLRAVLGDEELSYLGTSYGSRLGAVYADMFPDNVRALVLDGAMNPYAATAERRESQYAGLQRSFELMGASCTELPDCPLGSDPDAVTERFQEIVQPLLDEPVPAGDGRVLTYFDATDGVVSGLYSEASWPTIIEGIREVRDGRGETLMGLHDGYYQRSADGSYSNALEATEAINCLDEVRHTPEQETALQRTVIAAAPFADPGRPLGETRNKCESWPVEPTLGYPYATDIEGLADTLTVAVTGDPVAPYEDGTRLAEALDGSLLTVEGEQHGAALVAGNACVDDIVADYLVNLDSPPADARCTLE